MFAGYFRWHDLLECIFINSVPLHNDSIAFGAIFPPDHYGISLIVHLSKPYCSLRWTIGHLADSLMP